jgi:hypothetical protein
VTYIADTGTLAIPAKAASANLVVLVNGDVDCEDDETFRVVLSNPSGATVEVATAVGTITNDDCTNDVGPSARYEFALGRVSPVPATTGRVTIEYTMGHRAPVRLEVTDVMGRVVAALFDGFADVGRHRAVWNGDGGRAPAGVCFLRYRAEGRETRRRIVWMR